MPIVKEKNAGLFSIYTMNSFQELAFSLIGIFIPIYFLKLGFSLPEVFWFFLVQAISVLVFSFVAIYIANRIGLEKTLIVRLPFLFIYLFSLLFLENNFIWLMWLALIGGAQTALYFIPLHILFAQNAEAKTMGASLGKYFALPKLAVMLGPVIGGLIAAALGFRWLIGLVIVIFAFSMIPYLKSETRRTDFHFSFKVAFKLYRKYPKLFFAEICENFGEEADGVLWPIFIYLSLASVVSVGTVGLFVGLGSFVFTVFMGKFTDRQDKKKLVKAAALLFMAVWILRYTVNNESLFYLSTILSGFAMMLMLIPYTSILYTSAKEGGAHDFMVMREIPVAIGRVLFFALALILWQNPMILFPITALAYLYFFFL